MDFMDLDTQNGLSKQRSLTAKLLKDHEYILGFDFNCILVGKLFEADQNKLLIGTTQGKIHVFLNGKEEESLETKGSGIVSMCIHDVTKFGWSDLIVGDSLGNTTLFSRKEILGRHDFGVSITSICVDKATSNIIVGDRQGCLHCFVPPFDILWNVASLDNHNPSLNTLRMSGEASAISTTQTATQTTVESSVKCCSALLVDAAGNPMSALLVADGSPFLHFYNQSLRVYSLLTPARITSICCGLFQVDDKQENRTQIALGCENGFIYLVKDYQLKPFITVGNYITNIQSFKPSENRSSTHMLLCAGHFNALNVYIEDQLALSIETEDWVHTFHVGDINNDSRDEVVIGTVNNTIRAYVLQNS